MLSPKFQRCRARSTSSSRCLEARLPEVLLDGFPRMDKGGLFLGHNVINKRDEMADFLKTIHSSPAVLTSIVAPSGEGVSITLKR